MTKIEVSNFTTRAELEREIERLVGRTTEKKLDIVITGSVLELKRFAISPHSRIFGVGVEASDFNPQRQARAPKPNRGKIHPFGINGRKK